MTTTFWSYIRLYKMRIMSTKQSIFFISLLIVILSAGVINAAEANNTQEKPINIGAILGSPDSYIGHNVTVSGTITSQCGSGCWFILNDDTGDLYVTLRANNFVIPPAIGKKVTVTGLVEKKGDIFMTGSKVTVGDKIYP
jgi:hypothetical protein